MPVSRRELRQWVKLLITSTPRIYGIHTPPIIATCVDSTREQRAGNRETPWYVSPRSREFAEKRISIRCTLLLSTDVSRNILCRRIFYSRNYLYLVVAVSSVSPPYFRGNTTGRNADTDDRWEAAILSTNRTWKTIAGNNTCGREDSSWNFDKPWQPFVLNFWFASILNAFV